MENLLLWARHHHYPQLVLGRVGRKWDVIRAGNASWHYFMESATHERVERALVRVEIWKSYERQVQAA